MHKTTTKGTCSNLKWFWLYFWSKKKFHPCLNFYRKKKEIGHLKKTAKFGIRIPSHQNRQLAIYSLTCGNHPPKTCLQDYRSILLSSRQIWMRPTSTDIAWVRWVHCESIDPVKTSDRFKWRLIKWSSLLRFKQLFIRWKLIIYFLNCNNRNNIEFDFFPFLYL